MYDWRDDWLTRFGRTEPKIVCVGLNYTDHAAEQGVRLPSNPMLFAKFASALCGDGEDIVLPRGIGHVDAEAELAVVIGCETRATAADDALEVVHGYLGGNDVSARDLQFGDGQWFRGKSQDTFCPIGPGVVHIRNWATPATCAWSSASTARRCRTRAPAGSSSGCATWSRSRRAR